MTYLKLYWPYRVIVAASVMVWCMFILIADYFQEDVANVALAIGFVVNIVAVWALAEKLRRAPYWLVTAFLPVLSIVLVFLPLSHSEQHAIVGTASREDGDEPSGKLNVVSWGLAGGFIFGRVPGSGLGGTGVAGLVISLSKLGEAVTIIERQGNVWGLVLLLICIAVGLSMISAGYQKYSRAYDMEVEDRKKNKNAPLPASSVQKR